jgi:hypothetical protein
MSTLAFFADMSAGTENLTTGVPGDSPSVPSLTRSTYGTFKPSKPQATTTKDKRNVTSAASPAINKKCDHATETWFSRLFGWESYHLTTMKSMGIDEAIEAEAQAQAICMQTEDFERAYHAFVAKEKPLFEGN